MKDKQKNHFDRCHLDVVFFVATMYVGKQYNKILLQVHT